MLAVKRLPPGARWLVRDMAVKTGRSEQEVEETILDLLARGHMRILPDAAGPGLDAFEMIVKEPPA